MQMHWTQSHLVLNCLFDSLCVYVQIFEIIFDEVMVPKMCFYEHVLPALLVITDCADCPLTDKLITCK